MSSERFLHIVVKGETRRKRTLIILMLLFIACALGVAVTTFLFYNTLTLYLVACVLLLIGVYFGVCLLPFVRYSKYRKAIRHWAVTEKTPFSTEFMEVTDYFYVDADKFNFYKDEAVIRYFDMLLRTQTKNGIVRHILGETVDDAQERIFLMLDRI